MSTSLRALLSIFQIVACVAISYSNSALRLQESQLKQHDDWWSIEIKYPVIEGDNSFNTAVRQHVNASADGFRKNLPRTASKGYPDYGAYLKGKYKAQVLSNGIVTVFVRVRRVHTGSGPSMGCDGEHQLRHAIRTAAKTIGSVSARLQLRVAHLRNIHS
jgi:hypothetical protein